MMVTIHFFAQLKERLGKSIEIIHLNKECRVSDIFEKIFPSKIERRIFQTHLRVAVNEEYSAMDTILSDGDEVVFIPPVAGG